MDFGRIALGVGTLGGSEIYRGVKDYQGNEIKVYYEG